MQDMIPPAPRDGRSIRNIPVSNKPQRQIQRRQEELEEKEFLDTPLPRLPTGQAGPIRPRRSRRVLWFVLGVALVCATASILLATIFAGASITLYPKTQIVTPPASILAEPDAPSGVLPYQTMSITRSASTTVAASGTQHVSKTATGVITIFNGYSTASQKLVATTRFEAPDGKIYRIRELVTVPGATKKQDGTLTPGSTTATVYASVAGADYNLAQATHFTLPGFKGDPQYSKFYAQSQGAVSGGFVGEQAAVAPADMVKAQQSLQSQLSAAVASASTADVPTGFLPVANSLVTTYATIAQTQGTGTTVILSQSANGQGAIVRESDLAAAIAAQVVSGYRGEVVVFVDPSKITISVPSGTKPTGALTLALAGTPTLVWQFDADAIKQALLGKKKVEFEAIIKTFQPGVDRATLTVRPFWQSSLPTDPSKLTVTATQQ
ncbi:MAG: hypothetical protein Q7S26_00255 [bacterium]|nr:hypothetical protein [bacterium]